jgi:thiamine pyrophosphokinase
VVAADGGSKPLLDAGLPFQAVIGDLDSAPERILQSPTEDFEVIHDTSQDTTDAEKALYWVLQCTDARDIILTASQSSEIDHVLATFSVCAKYAHRGRVRIVEDRCLVHFVTDEAELHLPQGTTLSLLGLPSADRIQTHGLRWPLSAESLRFGMRDGVHNEVMENPVRLSIREGCLGVFLCRNRSDPFRWPDS